MHNQHQQLNEGLRADDLREMVHPTFEVDSFRSKMGEDQDVCVISFKVSDRSPAKDLMEFIEKGYAFVLDADVSSGEDNRGEYSVFVEIARTARLSEQIKELTYGVKKLTGLDDLKFKYHKESQVYEATEENLKKKIPDNSTAYQGLMDRMRTESVRGFFTKTLMDDLTLDGDIITIHKPFDRTVKLQIIKDGATESILEGIEDGYTVDEAIPRNPYVSQWYEAISSILPEYEINTPQRVAAFLAQCAHESGGFVFLKENLNYKAASLRKVFPKYFPDDATAAAYANKPERIANRVYANRMGNGDEASGDGWRYCGRGLIQLTGKDNYTFFAASLDIPVEEASEYLQTFEGAVQSACFFWEQNNLNKWADAGDILTLTKRINGGTIGLEDRIKHYEHALHIFGD